MQHDEIIWQVIRHKHCSFMSKLETGIFCRNPYNVTGVCNRSSCPLANSRYATIRDHDGVFYLYMKTIERAHMPNKLWERVKLPVNYEKALDTIDKHLMYWPKFLVHQTKQRLTKMTQMRIRMRKLVLKTREKIMTIPRKDIKRERRREDKALIPAKLDESIKKELLTRLKNGVYPYPINFFEKHTPEVEETEQEDEEEPVIEFVGGYELEEEEEDDIEDIGRLAMHHSHIYDDIAGGIDEEAEAVTGKRERKESDSRKFGKDKGVAKSKKPRVLIEVDDDDTRDKQMVLY